MPIESTSDRSLMASLKAGEMQAFVILIERWERRLLAFIYRYVHDESMARDLAEETFIRLYMKCDRYDEARPFPTWLFGIAANLCRNHKRWLRRHPESGIEGAPESVDNWTPAMQVSRTERDRELARAVTSLPHGLRVALLLHYYEELPYAEIARIVGCTVRGVESRLYRARKLLARKLELNSRVESQGLTKQCSATQGN